MVKFINHVRTTQPCRQGLTQKNITNQFTLKDILTNLINLCHIDHTPYLKSGKAGTGTRKYERVTRGDRRDEF